MESKKYVSQNVLKSWALTKNINFNKRLKMRGYENKLLSLYCPPPVKSIINTLLAKKTTQIFHKAER